MGCGPDVSCGGHTHPGSTKAKNAAICHVTPSSLTPMYLTLTCNQNTWCSIYMVLRSPSVITLSLYPSFFFLSWLSFSNYGLFFTQFGKQEQCF